MEWSGGIGDVFYWTWVSGHYCALDDLREGEYATVVNRCRTPGLEELLKWHPKRAQIELIDLSWHPKEVTCAEDRAALGLPEPSPHMPLTKEPVFYPSPEDHLILPGLKESPYIVFALSGSFPDKNVPPEIADRFADLCLKHGYRVIVVGKTYQRRVPRADTIKFDDRCEVRVAPRDGVIDMIDRLTLPGTCDLVRSAAGVLCCDSSIMHLSLRMGKPTFITIPDKWFDYWYSIDAASWGKSVPHADYTKVSEYNDNRVFRWLKKNKLSGEKR